MFRIFAADAVELQVMCQVLYCIVPGVARKILDNFDSAGNACCMIHSSY
ncbi:hypothetical protein [Desulfurispira natronophila]|uniref:Uncharacterized protein n=1 Tax=Desulfurispira natronophila TaxID=682562 RepID=A0A7W7Y290_9BACT|nr:hypothetical protein [Desulfurispira natronophila]